MKLEGASVFKMDENHMENEEKHRQRIQFHLLSRQYTCFKIIMLSTNQLVLHQRDSIRQIRQDNFSQNWSFQTTSSPIELQVAP